MKKILLPLVAMLLGGAAAQAEDVTMKFYGVNLTTQAIGEDEVFKPLTQKVTKNFDGSYTIEKFLDAKKSTGEYALLKFSFGDDGKITFADYTTGNNYAFVNLNKSSFANTGYFTQLSSLDDVACNFEATLWIPAASYKYTPTIVEKLGDDSEYTYRVTITAAYSGGAASCPACLSSWFTSFPSGAPFICVFDMVKKSESGIADVVVDEADAPVEYFNLQGVRMNGDNLAPGIYVKRQGSKATKVLVK